MTHSAFGLRVASAIDLPVPESADAESLIDVEIRVGTVDTRGVSFLPLDGVEDIDGVLMDQAWDRDRIVLDFLDAKIELRAFDPTVLVDPGSGDADYIAHLVLDHVVPRWLALHGDLVLHAGTVVGPDGRAIAFVGESGRGKSTTVTALAGAGWSLLGDDACRITRVDGQPTAWPSYAGTRLLPDSRAVLAPDVPSVPLIAGAEKHRLIPRVEWTTQPAPLSVIVALGKEAAAPDLRRLSLSEATATLVRHSFHMAPSHREIASRAFDLCSALAADVPCFEATFPRRFDVYPELVDLLTGVLARP